MANIMKEHLIPFAGTCLIAGCILTILAPYGTHTMTFLPRSVFWVGLCMAGGLGAASVTYICYKRNLTLNPVIMALWQSVGSTLLVSLFVIGLNYSQSGSVSAVSTAVIIFYVWVIAITLSGIGNLIGTRQTSLANTPVSRPVIFERLKPGLRSADIHALSSEDHYVRVYTSKGEDLILMRLSDAIREVSPLEGLMPHRSWWVAEAGVKSVTRHDGKTSITLKNGVPVSVSRSRNKDLKQAGWI